MNLTDLRSIHMPEGRAAAAESGTAETAAPAPVLRLRKVPRSPTEEFAARVAKHGAMERFPDALAAILLYEHKTPTLTQKSEIAFDINGVEFRFYHPDALTCHPSNAGKQVRVSFDRDDLSCVFVLSEDGRYVETVPRKGKHAWFGKEAGEEIARYKRVASHVHAHLDRIHAPDNKREMERAQSNAEKIQYLNEFPAPRRDGEMEEPRAEFTAAREIMAAAETARLQQARHKEAVSEEEDLAALARKAQMADYRSARPEETLEEQ